MPPRVKIKHVTKSDDQGPLLYTRQQVAKLLNCSAMTVARMEQDGRLRSFKLAPGLDNARCYIKAADVTALIEKMVSASGTDDAR